MFLRGLGSGEPTPTHRESGFFFDICQMSVSLRLPHQFIVVEVSLEGNEALLSRAQRSTPLLFFLTFYYSSLPLVEEIVKDSLQRFT